MKVKDAKRLSDILEIEDFDYTFTNCKNCGANYRGRIVCEFCSSIFVSKDFQSFRREYKKYFISNNILYQEKDKIFVFQLGGYWVTKEEYDHCLELIKKFPLLNRLKIKDEQRRQIVSPEDAQL
jgi:hypothetical protein